MEVERIAIAPRVRLKLTRLVRILFEKGYFGFLDSAEKYVDSIYGTIQNIPNLKHFRTKNKNTGLWYVRHKANKDTSYYLIFDKKDSRYLVRDILTNHERTYKSVK